MAQRWLLLGVLLFSIWLLPESSEGYNNFTVGDEPLGWRLGIDAPNYPAWAAKYNFSLGDYLLFRFNTSHSVATTTDPNIYATCNFTDGENVTILARVGVDSSADVMLRTLGMNFFACPTNADQHCKLGMKFGINVTQGQGLPPSPPASPPPPPGTAAPPAATTISSPPPPSKGSQVFSRGTWFMTLVMLLLLLMSN